MASNNSIVFQNFFILHFVCFAAACLLHPLPPSPRRSTIICDSSLPSYYIPYSFLHGIHEVHPEKITTKTEHIEGRTNGFATDDGNFLFHSGMKFSVELSIQCWGCCSLIWELFDCAQSTQTALFAHISKNPWQLLHISVLWSLCMQCALSVVRRFNILFFLHAYVSLALSLSEVKISLQMAASVPANCWADSEKLYVKFLNILSGIIGATAWLAHFFLLFGKWRSFWNWIGEEKVTKEKSCRVGVGWTDAHKPLHTISDVAYFTVLWKWQSFVKWNKQRERKNPHIFLNKPTTVKGRLTSISHFNCETWSVMRR